MPGSLPGAVQEVATLGLCVHSEVPDYAKQSEEMKLFIALGSSTVLTFKGFFSPQQILKHQGPEDKFHPYVSACVTLPGIYFQRDATVPSLQDENVLAKERSPKRWGEMSFISSSGCVSVSCVAALFLEPGSEGI